MLIGFLGKIGAGKTTMANMLIGIYPEKFIKMAFADELKEIAIKYFNLLPKEVYFKKNNFSRTVLQGIGAFVRHEISEDFWIKKLNNRIKDYYLYLLMHKKHILIDDVRYRNESKYIKDNNGIVIKLICPDNPANLDPKRANHESEKEVDLAIFDYVAEAKYGDIDNLYSQVWDILKNNSIL